MINIGLAHTCERSIRVVTVYLLYDAYRADVIFCETVFAAGLQDFVLVCVDNTGSDENETIMLIFLKWYDSKAVYKKYTAFFERIGK